MKCDELKSYNVVATVDVNPEVVDSLGCTEWTGYDKNEVDAAIAELKTKLEDVQATAYAESVDAGMENRKLKRALWLARADRAVAAQSVHEWCRYNEKHPCGLWKADPFECWVQAWICVEKLCRKKAKEYK